MVKVREIKRAENSKGEEFFMLVLESGAMAVKSKQTGRVYFTSKRAYVSTTFDEQTASSLIGTEFEGTIRKVETDPYEYTIEETGEIIQLSHRYEFVDPVLDLDEQVVSIADIMQPAD